MIKENINGIATPIKKLYEYVNSVKQPISKRYEYVDGVKQLVYQNKVIKRELFINANGIPQNNFSGGTTNSYIRTYGRYETFTSSRYFSNYLMTLNTFNLGNASGKRITKIEFDFEGDCRLTETDEISQSRWSKFRVLVLDNNNASIQTMEYTSASKDMTGSYGGHFFWSNIHRTITLDKVITTFKIQLQTYNTSLLNPHLYGSSSAPGCITFGFRNLYITYEDYV